MLKLEQVKLKINYSEDDVLKKCARILNINTNGIESFKILKKAIDARKKPEIYYVLTVGICLKNDEEKFANLRYEEKDFSLKYEKIQSKENIFIVGFGPSGMFAGLSLARMGLKPIIIEQGKQVEEREKDVLKFWGKRELNPYSNVQFGEGGAGTFSDGKLNSNLDSDFCKSVIQELYKHGAPEEITYISKPHIGSDKLKTVVQNIREEIISLGGKFLFNTKLVDFDFCYNQITEITLKNVITLEETKVKADKVLLCVGHSARDTFKLLYNKKVELHQKPFAMGVRIEQKQIDINLAQYGEKQIKGLPNADYKLVVHLPNDRSVFTFCMCPGGEVVASSTNDGEIVTNGMSQFARDKENANSAVLVNIIPQDYESDYALAGIDFQAKYEKLAYEIGGKNFNAPAQSVGSFLNKNNSIQSEINYTYRPNITLTNIEKCLPKIVTDSLRIGLPLLDKKLKGFAKQTNLLIAIESRTSCPLRIERDENFESNIKGLYPVGEGAGYSGGIISSAQDGIKVANKIYEKIKGEK